MQKRITCIYIYAYAQTLRNATIKNAMRVKMLLRN